MDWTNRAMSPKELQRSIAALGLGIAAAGRWFGVSERTMHRMLDGETDIPVAMVYLVRWMLEAGIRPRAPKHHSPPSVVAEHLTPPTA
jgi:hypothetical protein